MFIVQSNFLAEQIYGKAMVAAGFIEDPRVRVARVYIRMERLATKEAGNKDA